MGSWLRRASLLAREAPFVPFGVLEESPHPSSETGNGSAAGDKPGPKSSPPRCLQNAVIRTDFLHTGKVHLNFRRMGFHQEEVGELRKLVANDGVCMSDNLSSLRQLFSVSHSIKSAMPIM